MYKRIFNESNIAITKNTQQAITKYIRDKKYVSNTGTLKVSFQDMLNIIPKLQDALTKEPNNVEIKKAINELKKNSRNI